MLSDIKSIIGIADTVTDYDMYIVIICAVGIFWAVKSVITCLINTVTYIFR